MRCLELFVGTGSVGKVLSAAGGFKIMVNEHNRISIPMIFLTETQLAEADTKGMRGGRCRCALRAAASERGRAQVRLPRHVGVSLCKTSDIWLVVFCRCAGGISNTA